MNAMVIFGPTQIGKSTLAGYLMSYRYSFAEFNRCRRRMEHTVRKMGIGATLEKSMILPCFVSMDRDELQRFPNSAAIGTTKRLHRLLAYLPRVIDGKITTDESDDIEVVFIDTPGTHTKLTEKYRGIFEANVGLFLMNAIDLMNIDQETIDEYPETEERATLQKYVRPLMFWFASKKDAPIIVAVSKADLLDKASIELCLLKAKRIVACAKGFTNAREKDVPIVPISVTLETGAFDDCYPVEWNILQPKYEQSLVEVLNQNIPVDANRKEKEVFFSSPDRIMTSSTTKEQVIRQKVIDGHISSGDEVVILPVSVEEETCAIQGIIKSTRVESTEGNVPLSQGWIGGMAFRTLRRDDAKKSVSLDDVRLKKTSIIIGKGVKYTKGLYFVLRINKDEIDDQEWMAISHMYPKEQITIIWQDKPVAVNLLYRSYNVEQRYVELVLAPLADDVRQSLGYFVLPDSCINDYYTSTVVIHQNQYRGGRLRTNNYYCSGRVISINDYRGYRFRLRISGIRGEIDPNAAREQNIRVENDAITIEGIKEENLGQVYKRVRSVLKRSQIEDYYGVLSYDDHGIWKSVGYNQPYQQSEVEKLMGKEFMSGSY